jgi:hypothetical protein
VPDIKIAPDKRYYADSIHPSLRTVIPLEVCFERTETGYAAVVQELDEYGLGTEDLGKTLQELYFSLERDEGRLSSDLLAVWAGSKRHLVRI